jgi:hypothetical protein
MPSPSETLVWRRSRVALATGSETRSYTIYRTTPSSGELAVAYNFFGMRPER